jgi:hypothetical protein
MATIKSKIARSKKKSSKAATSISEEPPSPEDGARKCSPEELGEEEEPKQKVTTLWSRGKAKRVVVVDLPKGKDTGPPSNENGVSFCKQCNINCISSSATSCNLCCERETHVSLNNVGEYVVFPAKTVQRGFFQCSQQDCCLSATFCGYSNSAKLPRVNLSKTLTIGIQTGTMSVSSKLSKSVLINWDADIPNNELNPPSGL